MRYRDNDLRGVPAVTRGGKKLGKLTGFVLEPATHEIAQYVVSRGTFISKFIPDELLIAPSQVVSLDADLLVVDDGAVPAKEAAVKVPKAVEAAAHAVQRGE